MADDDNNPNNHYYRVPNSKSHSSSDLASCSKLFHQENHRRRKTTDDNNELEDEEAEHFERIIATFVHYKARCLRQLQKQLFFYNRLTPRHKSMLQNKDDGADSYVEHLKRVKSCIDENQQFLNLIIGHVGRMFENQNYDDHGRRSSTTKRKKWTDEQSVSEFNMEKLRSTLKQFVRDWAEEGKEERETCYAPLLEDLKRLFPDPKGVEVLVPGAGLGRLAWDIAKAGYNCEGNEFSLFMLFGSNYILNHCKSANSVTIYPFVHQWTNNLSYEDQIRPVSIPHIETSSPMPDGVKFCMSAGDFTQIYAKKRSYPMQQANGSKNEKNYATGSRAEESLSANIPIADQKTDVELGERYDCIITVFFIDTARNIFDYLDLIRRLLKPGGYWLNFGPLLYHHVIDTTTTICNENYTNSAPINVATIPLPYDQLRRVIENEYKFEFVQETLNLRTTYAQNNRSMLKYDYNCVKFVCKKERFS